MPCTYVRPNKLKRQRRSGSETSRVVLVTGASTGIGLALVQRLRSDAYRVVATARASALGRFAEKGLKEDGRLWIRALDVNSAADQERIVTEINETWGGVDVLVNNAGVSYCAVTEDMTPAAEREQFAVNFVAPLALIRRVVPRMRERRSGHIINVSSVGGMMAMPTMGAYSASKFALEGASESLWYEMRPWGIRVSLIEPGFVHSMSFRNVKFTNKSRRSAEDPTSPYHRYYASMSPFISKMMRLSRATPDHVARTIVNTMRRSSPKLRVPATFDAWAFYYLRRALPRRLYHFVLYRSLPRIDSWVD